MLIEGYKFDLRIYVLMTSIDPLTFYIFDDGIVRMATEPYEAPSKGNLSKVFQHLTNYSINKNSPFFFASENGEEANTGFKRSLKFLKNYFALNNIDF